MQNILQMCELLGDDKRSNVTTSDGAKNIVVAK
jgi:hypothetical protein